ncbi:MAG: amidase [Nocardioidaceae bacterium]
MTELEWAGVTGQADAIRRGEVSSRELTTAVLERIARYDGRLNAFTVVMADEALAEADARDADPVADRGPLHGVPIAIKEEVDVAGQVTTFGGRGNHTPIPTDAAVVTRLRKAGAVIVGKTNMPEFGLWPFTESVAHGITRNPWDTSRTPGGSSGGTAAAVAAGLVAAGIGGDGGGSIRIPSACCGLFGLKPQRGRVTMDPHEHGWWALSTTGPLTRSVRDSAVVYDVIRGSLPADRWRAEDPPMSFTAAADAPARPLRVGWSVTPAAVGVRPHPAHVRAVQDTAALLESLGHHVEEVDPHYPDPTAAFVPQFFAGLHSSIEYVEDRSRIERRTKETDRLGRWVTPGVREWAIRRGRAVAARANRVFATHDVLLTPTIAPRPPEVGVLDGTGSLRASLAAMPMIAYTALWNVTGNPAASVPAGFASDGLPLAVQLVSRPDDETTLLTLSAQLEQARPWADARPPL